MSVWLMVMEDRGFGHRESFSAPLTRFIDG